MGAEQDFYLPRKKFIQVGHLAPYRIRTIVVARKIAEHDDGSLPVLQMVDAINTECQELQVELKKYKAAFSKKSGDDTEEDIKINLDIKRENLLAKKITNQQKLLELIPKHEAEERVKLALTGAKILIEKTMPLLAQKLINIKEPRDIEIVISKEWNRSVEILKDASIMKPWELDGTSKMLRTRLLNAIEDSGSDSPVQSESDDEHNFEEE
jgi:hypothetical protein